MLRAQQIDAALTGDAFDPTPELFAAAARLTDDEVLRQTAADIGVAVGPADVEAELVAELAPELGEGPLDADGRALYEERARQYVDLRRLSLAQLERLAEGEVLRAKTTAELARSIADPQPQLRLLALAFAGVRSAEAAAADVAGGVAIEEAARRYAVDGAVVDLGWLPREALPPAASDLLWELPERELSPPFLQENQAVVLYVVAAREESRPLDAGVRQVLEERAFEAWLTAARNAQEIELRLDNDTLEWALAELEETPAVIPGGP